MKWALILCAFGTTAALADNPAPTAQQVLSQMGMTYRNCSCYEDSGVVETVFTSSSRVWTNTKPFEIHFRRPALFRFEFTSQHFPNSPTNRYVLWSDGTQTHAYWQSANSYWAEASLSKGLAGATGVSGGSARTIPSLLSDALGGIKLTDLENLALRPEEALEGVDCYVVTGDYPPPVASRSCALWIGKKDFLLRQKKEQLQLPDGTVTASEEIHRLIKMNRDIPDAAFSFTPPAEAKSVAGIESMLADSQRQLAEAQARAEAATAAARQRQMSVLFIDCGPDGVTIPPGATKLSLEDLGHKGNSFEKLLDEAATNPSFNRMFVMIKPGSMATYHAIQNAVSGRPLTVQYEPADEDNAGIRVDSNGTTNRVIRFTSSHKQRSPIPAGKHAVEIKCSDNQVYLVGGDGQSETSGISLEDLAKPDGRFQAALLRSDRKTQYISFKVTDDSFPVFRKARDIAEGWAFDTSWELAEVGPPVTSGADAAAH
ncbi:MAG TPA: hypothetical protein VMP11_14395 [Verrucomicrobiae bacterium]|nr:hypothetical protein [Verrucomicrobiae bacterium]